jgi:tetratricopeptide (TPR) repeat protein
MRRSLRSLSIIVLSGLLLFMGAEQFVADFYWRMAHKDGDEQNKTIEYLERCIAIDSENAMFHFSLGRAYLREAFGKSTPPGKKNDWIRKSVREFHEAVDLNPLSADYHFHLGISYESLAYPPPFYWEVIQNSLKRAALLNLTDVRRLYSMGMYYVNEYNRLRNMDMNTLDLRSPEYERYVALSKDNYQFFFRKLLDANDEYFWKILRECFSVNQEYADLRGLIRDIPRDHAFLARFLNKKGMWEEAKKEFRVALNLEPTNPMHYSSFAHALFKRGYYENAIDWWQRQKALDPRNEKPYLFSVTSFVKLKQFDDALREIRQLIALYPENITYQVKLIRVLMAARRFDEAIEEYHKRMEKNPNFSKNTYNSVRYYQKRGNHSKAAKILDRALTSFLHK